MSVNNHPIQVGAVDVRFHLVADQTGGMLTMFDFGVPPGARVPIPHSHDAFDETVYGLEGVLTWMVDGTATRVGPGDVLFIPRGHVHQFQNVDDRPARNLSVITPGILGPDYFLEIAAVLAAGGPPNVAAITEVMRRHGLRPVPPAA